MRHRLGVLTTLLILATAAHADRVSKDPNVSAAASAGSAQRTDARLAQQVSYRPGYARLHSIADDLTRLTGVGVRAGQNKQDWQVRDIPLVICVKEMPLGKLLRLVAAAAHVDLRAESVNKEHDDRPTYRFYRARKNQQAIDDALYEVEKANRDLAMWAWDTLVAYSKLPVTDLTIAPEKFDFDKIDSQQVRIVSEILGSLDTSARDQLFSGQQVTVTYAKSARQDLMRKLLGYICSHPGFGSLVMGMNSKQTIEWTDADLNESMIVMGFTPRDRPISTAGLTFMMHGIPVQWERDGQTERLQDSWEGNLVKMAKAVAATKVTDVPPPPDVEAVYYPKDSIDEPGFVGVDLDSTQWTAPLDEKVTLKSDPALPQPSYAQGLVALSRTARFSIVADDFNSHKCSFQGWARVNWNAEKSIGAILAYLDARVRHQQQWFVDKDRRVLVGWDGQWRRNHRSLVSERLLDEIMAKRKTEGAELDDIAPLLLLTREQRSDWVTNTPDFVGLEVPFADELALWQLYAMLGPEERSEAKSETGLALFGLDTDRLSNTAVANLHEAKQGILTLADPGEVAAHSPPIQALLQPSTLRTCVLRVREVEQRQWMVPIADPEATQPYLEYHWTPGGVEKHTYEVSLTGHVAGEEKTAQSTWRHAFFPYYTLKREAELIRKASTTAEAK